jgi:hypothetical protein
MLRLILSILDLVKALHVLLGLGILIIVTLQEALGRFRRFLLFLGTNLRVPMLGRLLPAPALAPERGAAPF